MSADDDFIALMAASWSLLFQLAYLTSIHRSSRVSERAVTMRCPAVLGDWDLRRSNALNPEG